MAFVTAIGDIFPLVTAITDTNVSNGCDNGAVTCFSVQIIQAKIICMTHSNFIRNFALDSVKKFAHHEIPRKCLNDGFRNPLKPH